MKLVVGVFNFERDNKYESLKLILEKNGKPTTIDISWR